VGHGQTRTFGSRDRRAVVARAAAILTIHGTISFIVTSTAPLPKCIVSIKPKAARPLQATRGKSRSIFRDLLCKKLTAQTLLNASA
jgi:hypothetical protein